MILRRLKAHVEKENWFAVAIDFAIVVIGVFIGIQVANWNEAKGAAQKEAVILAQLDEEFTEIEDLLDQTIPYAEQTVEAVRNVLRVIRSGNEPEDRAEFMTTLQLAGSFSSGRSMPLTLVELLESGSLSDLSSPELRQALTQYHQTMQTHDAIRDLVLQRISSPDEGFHDAIYVNPDHGADGAPLLDDYDWDRMAETRQQFQVLYYGKSSFLGTLRQMQSDAQAVLDEIDAAQRM